MVFKSISKYFNILHTIDILIYFVEIIFEIKEKYIHIDLNVKHLIFLC